MGRTPVLPFYTNTFLLITLVPQPLLLSVCLFLLIDSLFYLYIFTPILFIEIFTLYTLLLSIHIWISDMVMTFFKTLTTLYPFLFVAMLLFVNSEFQGTYITLTVSEYRLQFPKDLHYE